MFQGGMLQRNVARFSAPKWDLEQFSFKLDDYYTSNYYYDDYYHYECFVDLLNVRLSDKSWYG